MRYAAKWPAIAAGVLALEAIGLPSSYLFAALLIGLASLVAPDYVSPCDSGRSVAIVGSCHDPSQPAPLLSKTEARRYGILLGLAAATG